MTASVTVPRRVFRNFTPTASPPHRRDLTAPGGCSFCLCAWHFSARATRPSPSRHWINATSMYVFLLAHRTGSRAWTSVRRPAPCILPVPPSRERSPVPSNLTVSGTNTCCVDTFSSNAQAERTRRQVPRVLCSHGRKTAPPASGRLSSRTQDGTLMYCAAVDFTLA